MSEAKNILTVEDLAKELGIARGAAYALCKRTGLPAIRITPRRIVISADGLNRWLEDNAGKAV